MSLKFAIGGGIGLFLALIALKMPELLSRTKQHWSVWAILNNLRVIGFLAFTVILHQLKVRGAIISILVVTAIATALGLNEFKGGGEIPSIAPTFMQMDFEGLFTASMVGVIFVFFIVDLFDSTGTLVGVSHRAGLLQDGKLPRLKKALFADSTAIVAGLH